MTREARTLRHANADIMFRARVMAYYTDSLCSPHYEGILPRDLIEASKRLDEAVKDYDAALQAHRDALLATARTAPRAERQVGAGQ